MLRTQREEQIDRADVIERAVVGEKHADYSLVVGRAVDCCDRAYGGARNLVRRTSGAAHTAPEVLHFVFQFSIRVGATRRLIRLFEGKLPGSCCLFRQLRALPCP
jgi:hypothetical protein